MTMKDGSFKSGLFTCFLSRVCYDLRSRDNQMTLGHVVGTRLKRSVKAAKLKQ